MFISIQGYLNSNIEPKDVNVYWKNSRKLELKFLLNLRPRFILTYPNIQYWTYVPEELFGDMAWNLIHETLERNHEIHV